MNAEEAMLEFMGRPDYAPMKLEAIMEAIGAISPTSARCAR